MIDDWIGIILPTKDGKYVMARATIVDEDINTLKDAVISVSDVKGVKSDLKYPFVLLKDIEILKNKLIDDVLKAQDEVGNDYMETDPFQNAVIDSINKRFKYEWRLEFKR